MKVIKNKRTLIIVVIAILIYLFAGLAFVPMLRVFCESQNIVAYGAFILGAIIAIIVAGSEYEKWYEEDVITGKLPFSIKAAAFGTVASFAVAHIIASLRMILECFVQSDLITAGNVETGFTDWSGLEIFILVLATSMFGPMAEELIFRGLLLNTLWKSYGLHKAVIISSICFGLLHGNSLMTITSAILMGIVLAYTYAINRNLMDSIIAHLVYNTFVTYVAVHSEVTSPESILEIRDVLPEVLPSLFLSIMILILMSWLYKRNCFNTWRKNNEENDGRKM